jgi:tRNA-2-methylthio-N6-dimethylallyladenosine synthase
MQSRVLIETWGCQMNVHHAEGLAGLLAQSGYSIVEDLAEADVVLLNSCAVRQKAEDKVYGRIGALVDERRHRPLIIGLGGCIPQVYGERLLDALAAVDFLFGTTGFHALPSLIDAARTGERSVHLPAPIAIESPPYRRSPGVQAMVTITEGCSSGCAYCVVPRARGPLRSRPPDAILEEVRAALEDGFQEILLLGQNVDSYGTDTPRFGSFAGLLRAVAEQGPRRVRFTSSHPRDVTPELLETLADGGPLCPHLHLACQSGSDRILSAMRRGYDRDRFLGIVERARSLIPDLNITTDLIVGFPGETEEDFQGTMQLLDTARFGAVYAAMYSPRPQTRSAQLADDVTPDVKRSRLQRILQRQRALSLEMNRGRIGDTVEVLIEGQARGGGSFGRAADHRTVVVDESLAVGALITAEVHSASAAALHGRAVTAPVTAVEG